MKHSFRNAPTVAEAKRSININSFPKHETPQNYSKQELADDESYHITVIEAKDVQLRNGLLLGFGTFVSAASLIALGLVAFVASASGFRA